MNRDELGFFESLPMWQYLKDKGYSKSGLSTILSYSPKKFKHYVNYGGVTTAATELGTAAHELILEPDLFYQNYFMVDDINPETGKAYRKGTKAWEAILADNKGKTPLKSKEWDMLHKMRLSVENNPIANKLIDSPGPFESSIFWTDKETGLRCKCRPDKLHSNLGLVVDLKTTKDVRPVSFTRDSFNMKYHVSSAFTLEGLAQVGMDNYSKYLFLAVDKNPPYECIVYKNDEDAVAEGKDYYRKALRLIAECVEKDIWPGSNEDEIVDLVLPFKKKS